MYTEFGKFRAIQKESPILFSALEAANVECSNIIYHYFHEGEWWYYADDKEELRQNGAHSIQRAFEDAIREYSFKDFQEETGLAARYVIDEVFYIALAKIDRAAQTA